MNNVVKSLLTYTRLVLCPILALIFIAVAILCFIGLAKVNPQVVAGAVALLLGLYFGHQYVAERLSQEDR